MGIKISKRNHSSGFTLIELIAVIVILGILSATALPRFVDLQKDARIAALEAVQGTMRTAASLVFYRCILDLNQGVVTSSLGTQCSWGPGSGARVEVQGTHVHTAYSYPDAGRSGMDYAIRADENAYEFIYQGGSDFSALVFEVAMRGAPDSNNCRVIYTPPRSAGAEPTFEIKTSGC